LADHASVHCCEMEIKITPVEDLTVEDLENLARSTSLSYDDLRPVDVCREAMAGRALIWRYTGDDGESGVVVTQLMKRVGGTELFAWHMAGDGLSTNGKRILEVIEDHARECGCRWLAGLGTEYVADWLVKFLGFRKQSVLVVKEIDDGR